MKKKIIITEEQYKKLIEKKRSDKVIANKILESIEKSKKNLNESEMINEAVIDTLKKAVKKGLLTTAVIVSLLASNQVTASELSAAGVPQTEISAAQQNVGDSKSESETLFIVGQNYVIDGKRYKFLGYDEDGSVKFQGAEMPSMKRVKKSPRYDSNKGSVSNRKFYK